MKPPRLQPLGRRVLLLAACAALLVRTSAAPVSVSVDGVAYSVEIAGGSVSVDTVPPTNPTLFAAGAPPAGNIARSGAAAWSALLLARTGVSGTAALPDADFAAASAALRQTAPDGLAAGLAVAAAAQPKNSVAQLAAALAAGAAPGARPAETTVLALVSAAARGVVAAEGLAALGASEAGGGSRSLTLAKTAAAALLGGEAALASAPDLVAKVVMATHAGATAGYFSGLSLGGTERPASAEARVFSQIDQAAILGISTVTLNVIGTLTSPNYVASVLPNLKSELLDRTVAAMTAAGIPASPAIANLTFQLVQSAAISTGAGVPPIQANPISEPPPKQTPAVNPDFNASQSGG